MTNLRTFINFLRGLSLIVLGLLCVVLLLGGCKELQNDSKELTLKDRQLIETVIDRIQDQYVEEIPREKLIEGILNGIFSTLDEYSIYLNEKAFKSFTKMTQGRFYGIGVEIVFHKGVIRVIAPMDGTPAAKAGLRTGDKITHVNKESIAKKSPIEVIKTLQGKPGTTVDLTVQRKGAKPFDVTVKRALITVNPVKHKIIGNIAVIRLSYFSENAAGKLKLAINKVRKKLGKKLKGVVLDLRNNPGGTLEQAIAVSNMFLSSGNIVNVKGRASRHSQSFNASGKDMLKGTPIVMLVNGGSASAAEILAGCLQHHKRAIIMGIKTFGKGSVQEISAVPGYGGIKLTIARFYTPADKLIQNKGITPDIAVKQPKSTPVPLNLKEDKQLQRALDLLKGMSVFKAKGAK